MNSMKLIRIIKQSLQLLVILYLTVSLASPVQRGHPYSNGNIKSPQLTIQNIKALVQTSLQNPELMVFSAEFHKEFQFVDRRLGEGTNGVVYQAKHRTRNNIDIAIKIGLANNYKKCQDIPDVKFIQMAKKLNRNIGLIHYIGCGLELESKLYYFATEMVTNTNGGPELLQYLVENVRQTEVDTLNFLNQLAITLKQLHFQGIMHGDIKPENILIRQNQQLLLIDFGNSFLLHKNELWNKFRGTSIYASPQAKASIRDASKYYDARKDDVYALGITTLVMLGCYPHTKRTEGPFLLECENVPDSFLTLLKGMLNENEELRFTAKRILTTITNIRLRNSLMQKPTINDNKGRSAPQIFIREIDQIASDIILEKYINNVLPKTYKNINTIWKIEEIWNQSKKKLVVDLGKLNWENSGVLYHLYLTMLESYTDLAKNTMILSQATRISMEIPPDIQTVMQFNSEVSLKIFDILTFLRNDNNIDKNSMKKRIWAVVKRGIHRLSQYFAESEMEFSRIGFRVFTHASIIDPRQLMKTYESYRLKYKIWMANIDSVNDFQ